ncbi:MAG: hypothetical protein JWN48_1828 [Myxococcaceae bacterium]|nr:hypothetical protein [Myxococcaceae bacterium]
MTSRAKLAGHGKADHNTLIPYGGEQRRLCELEAVLLTPQDYSAIRRSLGGGKRGRARASELMSLHCPGCGCRLSHIERSGRSAHFAPTRAGSAHGPQCDPSEASVEPVSSEGSGREPVHAEAVHGELSSKQSAVVLPAAPIDAGPIEVTDALQLLVQALNRVVPSLTKVRYREQEHTLVAAADLHRLEDGAAVAVYGRLCEAEWNQQSGRLTLRATPRTVQVWATAGAPRALLRLALGQRIQAPELPKPVPFLVFGTLRKLASVCGIPVIRSEAMVLLQPLHAPAFVQTPEQAKLEAELTDELDALLSEPPPSAADREPTESGTFCSASFDGDLASDG